MTVLLRAALAVLFFCLSILIFLFPAQAKNYLDARYKGLCQYAFSNSSLALYVPNTVVAKTTTCVYKALSLIIALGGVAILLDHKKAIIVYAYLVMIFGGLLHMPYAQQQLPRTPGSQVRKLLCVFATFCAMLLIATPTQDQSQDTPSNTQ